MCPQFYDYDLEKGGDMSEQKSKTDAPEVIIGGETYVRSDIVDALVEALLATHRDARGAP